MEPTVLRGIDHAGHPYEAILNGPGDPVALTAPLDAQLPPTGTPVISGPAGIVRRFDPADPVTVYIWLRGYTDVRDEEGPGLLPDEPGDIVFDDDDDSDDEDDEDDDPEESLGRDLTAVLREDTVREFTDEAGNLWVWDAAEARYVRTAAGSKRYGLPIGAEITRKNNRDGYHDDTQVAKRRAYYARARARAQARHTAKTAARARKMRGAELEQAMQDAIGDDNMALFDKLAAEADRRDAQRAKREQRKADDDARKAEEFERLILDQGMDDEQATEIVYGITVERQRRQAAMASLRGSGYTGRSLEDLARAAYRDEVYQAFMRAENDTNGYLVSREGRAKNVDPLALFTGPEARARKWASPELKEWWDANGRPTFAAYLDTLVNGGALQRHRDDFHR